MRRSVRIWLLALACTGVLGPGATAAARDCDPACQAPRPDCCDGFCTALRDDPKNCGFCGKNCLAEGKVCDEAFCVPACPPPAVLRGDECVLVCDPPCAADEDCTEFATGTICCAREATPGRASACGTTCCLAGFQCCGGRCCSDAMKCCGDVCCAPIDMCLVSAEGANACCAPHDYCEDRCCTGAEQCASDGRCRMRCYPPCAAGSVCCSPGRLFEGGGRCAPVSDLCNDECCPVKQRCGTDVRDPSRKRCCYEESHWCDGVCCADDEMCKDGECVASGCQPPCAPDQACCSGFNCCECCTGDGYECGHFETIPYEQGEPLRVCMSDSTPPWFNPLACQLRDTTIYYQGIGGTCTGTLVACADSTELPCPFQGIYSVASSEPGPKVCCERWEAATESGKPCDPRLDLDCDGTPNPKDDEPMGPQTPRPERKPRHE